MSEPEQDRNQGELFATGEPMDQIGFDEPRPTGGDTPRDEPGEADDDAADREDAADRDDAADDSGPPDGPGGDGPRDGSGGDDPPEPPAGPEDDAESDGGTMGLLDHLAELRSVLIQSGLAALLAAALCWFWSARLLDILVAPIEDQGVYFTAPNEAFLTRLKLAGAVGLFVVAPFILFRIYGFVLPGLYRREKRVVTPLLIATTGLFYSGVAFSYVVVIPQVVRFLLSFGTQVMEPLIGIGPYFSFVARMCLAFGIVFELPLLILVLSVLGILKPRTLLRAWRFAVLIIFTVSALLTPPDVISQVMMAGPVLVLYLGSVLVSIVVTRKRSEED